jgi:aryl-alcohol dehydrogenase-like predicted oxidoreductase
MAHLSRRDFVRTGLAAGALASTGSLSLQALQASAAKKSATDWIILGDSGVKVTRLAFGTGSMSGAVQRSLGQEAFTKTVRYAYDNGVRFFETAESYSDMHRMLGIALQGIPRDTYRLMSKITTHGDVDPQVKINELCKLAQTDYFDIMLLHWQHTPTWPSDSLRWADGIQEAQQKKVVIARGASVHGLPALRQVPGDKWLEVAMIRCNHNGTRMDTEIADGPGLGSVPEVVTHIHQVKKEGMGVISMKLAGEGAFDHADRQAAMKFAFQNAKVDTVTVGYKNTKEIDEAIQNVNLALA